MGTEEKSLSERVLQRYSDAAESLERPLRDKLLQGVRQDIEDCAPIEESFRTDYFSLLGDPETVNFIIKLGQNQGLRSEGLPPYAATPFYFLRSSTANGSLTLARRVRATVLPYASTSLAIYHVTSEVIAVILEESKESQPSTIEGMGEGHPISKSRSIDMPGLEHTLSTYANPEVIRVLTTGSKQEIGRICDQVTTDSLTKTRCWAEERLVLQCQTLSF